MRPLQLLSCLVLAVASLVAMVPNGVAQRPGHPSSGGAPSAGRPSSGGFGSSQPSAPSPRPSAPAPSARPSYQPSAPTPSAPAPRPTVSAPTSRPAPSAPTYSAPRPSASAPTGRSASPTPSYPTPSRDDRSSGSTARPTPTSDTGNHASNGVRYLPRVADQTTTSSPDAAPSARDSASPGYSFPRASGSGHAAGRNDLGSVVVPRNPAAAILSRHGR